MTAQRCSGGAATLVLASALSAAGGCANLLYALNSERRKPVEAECDKLRGRCVAVVVWADASTLDADSHASTRAAYGIGRNLAGNAGRKELRGMTLVDPMKVSALQAELGNAGPTTPDSEVARRLSADAVLRVDLYEYTTRAPEANGLIMGRVSGNVVLYGAAEGEPLYRTWVSASFPENTRVGLLDRTDEDVLEETVAIFAERVARKFYAHEVEYE